MSEWLSGNLGDIADIVMGQSPTGESVNTNGLGVPLLNGPTEFTIRYPKAVQFSTDPKRFSKVNDILFCVRGSTTGRMNWADEDYAIGRGLAAIRHKQGEEYRYFVKAILDYYLDTMLASASGSTFPNVSKDQLNELEISYPSFPEQKAIASVLSSLDDKIDLLYRQNKTLEAMAETLFRQWFIEEAKEDWEDGVLGDIASNVRVNATIESIESDEIYIGLEHIERRNVALSQHGFGSDVASNKSRFKKHDILFGKLRPYFHKVCITPFDGICSTDILVLRAKETVWTAFTLFAFFQDSVVEYANLASGGTRMPRADWGSLSQYPIAIPPIGLVHQFNELVLPSIEKTHTNLEQIQTLENLRDTLLPKLMSGEVRVQYQTEEVA